MNVSTSLGVYPSEVNLVSWVAMTAPPQLNPVDERQYPLGDTLVQLRDYFAGNTKVTGADIDGLLGDVLILYRQIVQEIVVRAEYLHSVVAVSPAPEVAPVMATLGEAFEPGPDLVRGRRQLTILRHLPVDFFIHDLRTQLRKAALPELMVVPRAFWICPICFKTDMAKVNAQTFWCRRCSPEGSRLARDRKGPEQPGLGAIDTDLNGAYFAAIFAWQQFGSGGEEVVAAEVPVA